MAGPVLLYRLLIPTGAWSHGWGVPMATDTAFALALIAMLGRRVPVELRIFLTAATIVDDIGAIAVVALFYSGELHTGYLAPPRCSRRHSRCRTSSRCIASRRISCSASRSGLRCIGAGLHATLAGVILALCIPTREPPNYRSLVAQADAILRAEARTQRRRAAARAVRARDAGARRDPRSARIARRSHAAAHLRAFELLRAAALRVRQRRRGAGRRTCCAVTSRCCSRSAPGSCSASRSASSWPPRWPSGCASP